MIYSTHVDLDIAAPIILDLDPFAIPMMEWLIEHDDEDANQHLSLDMDQGRTTEAAI